METPPGAQRAISDKTPLKFMPSQFAAIMCFAVSLTAAGSVWATNIVVRQDTFQKGQDELRTWARAFDHRMARVERALGVKAPPTDDEPTSAGDRQ